MVKPAIKAGTAPGAVERSLFYVMVWAAASCVVIGVQLAWAYVVPLVDWASMDAATVTQAAGAAIFGGWAAWGAVVVIKLWAGFR